MGKTAQVVGQVDRLVRQYMQLSSIMHYGQL